MLFLVKKSTKFDKVVRREICRITTKGTRTFGIIDGETNDAENSFLIAISEKVFIFYIQTYFHTYTLSLFIIYTMLNCYSGN